MIVQAYHDALFALASLAILAGPAMLSFALASVVALVAAIHERPDDTEGFAGRLGSRAWEYLPAIVPVLLLGFMIGYTTGVSRQPIAGTLLTVCLTLIGGLTAYLFGKDNSNRALVAFCVTIFALNVFLGLRTGSLSREDERVLRHTSLAQQEKAIRTFRHNMGLNEDPPAWMLSGEPQAGK
jgi:hypothetical protein